MPYLDLDRKADIDWTGPPQRAAQLKVLVQDAEATLELAAEHDDVVTDDHGQPQIGEGTAHDRTLSVTESTSELIVDSADVPAPGRDGQYLPAMAERVAQHAGVQVERVIGVMRNGSSSGYGRARW